MKDPERVLVEIPSFGGNVVVRKYAFLNILLAVYVGMFTLHEMFCVSESQICPR